ncbi:class I adenylate-forming enzyme family protein [Salinirubellus sp. GCM10025818]|uniref:class I adenylate-forming enzyme family protein n=1 Tax=Salinirubellus TaxID=2162630 RepID=UPI0030CC1CF6
MHLEDVADEARTGNVAKLFDETARHHGDALAIEASGHETTHAELRAASEAFSGGLRDRGFGPGDRMLLYLPNCPQYLVASLGAFRAGVVVSPVNPQYKVRELTYQLEDTDADLIVTHPALRGVVTETLEETGRDPLVVSVGDEDERGDGDVGFEAIRGEPHTAECDPGDVALLPYTSGTTGQPKGVRLTHRNFSAQLLSYLASRTDDLADTDVKSLLYLPLYHITGFTHVAMQPLVRGGALYLRSPANWDAEAAMRTIEEEGITRFVGVTAMYVDMVNSDSFGDHDLSSLVWASEGGAKMSVAVQERFEEVAGVEMSEGYGLTETNGATHTQRGSTFGLRHGTIGQPLRHTECRVVDEDGEEAPVGEEGELLVRGPQVMAGYHGMPEATEAAFTERGFFRTGDVARRDADNYYEIVDRKKHMIVTAGYNVYPSEVEELLREHEAVADAAVIGVPDERRNEIPVAYVVPRPDAEPGDDLADAIREFCLANVAEYKHPRGVTFVEELPRTASGKIQKYKLEEAHEEGGTAEGDD